MKLTNKDKQAIRQALFLQIDTLLFAASDPMNSLYDDLKHLDNNDIALYCYKIVGLYPWENENEC